jgi:hypothetical protein
MGQIFRKLFDSFFGSREMKMVVRMTVCDLAMLMLGWVLGINAWGSYVWCVLPLHVDPQLSIWCVLPVRRALQRMPIMGSSSSWLPPVWLSTWLKVASHLFSWHALQSDE